MGVQVRWFAGFEGPGGAEGWSRLLSLRDARVVARSRTSLTEAGILDLPSGPVEVFRKTYSYPGFGAKARGLFRTTFGTPGRAAKEATALIRLHALGLAPVPVALAERRVLGLLDEAVLAVRAVPGGRDLEAADPAPGLAAAAGRAAGRMHAAGLGHLDLAPRNLVAVPRPGGGWEVFKVDSGSLAEVRRGGAEQARDLAELLAGLEERWRDGDLADLCRAYAAEAGAIPAGLETALPNARASLARRAPRG